MSSDARSLTRLPGGQRQKKKLTFGVERQQQDHMEKKKTKFNFYFYFDFVLLFFNLAVQILKYISSDVISSLITVSPPPVQPVFGGGSVNLVKG